MCHVVLPSADMCLFLWHPRRRDSSSYSGHAVVADSQRGLMRLPFSSKGIWKWMPGLDYILRASRRFQARNLFILHENSNQDADDGIFCTQNGLMLLPGATKSRLVYIFWGECEDSGTLVLWDKNVTWNPCEKQKQRRKVWFDLFDPAEPVASPACLSKTTSYLPTFPLLQALQEELSVYWWVSRSKSS